MRRQLVLSWRYPHSWLVDGLMENPIELDDEMDFTWDVDMELKKIHQIAFNGIKWDSSSAVLFGDQLPDF